MYSLDASFAQDPEVPLKQGKNPKPDVEIAFWTSKAANLNSIVDQIYGERIRKVLKTLETNRSTYCQPFAKLCKEVIQARHEANDNVKFLKTLEPWFNKREYDETFYVVRVFTQIFHRLTRSLSRSRLSNPICPAAPHPQHYSPERARLSQAYRNL